MFMNVLTRNITNYAIKLSNIIKIIVSLTLIILYFLEYVYASMMSIFIKVEISF